MQKLLQRQTYTPTDAPQVRGNCGLSLNREETLGVLGLKTCDNNPEVDLRQRTGGLKTIVYVLSLEGKPLMPCKPAKARKLLKVGRAKVVKLYPFTIKLAFVCENKVQPISLGIDCGYGNIGFSAVTKKSELVSGTLILDSKTSSRLNERTMYRRGRRSRHHWYRKPRFLNTKIQEGWLPPSTQRRYNTHLNLMNRMKAILPITKVTIEIANFDIAKIENPEISGVDYQQGDMYGYQNMRSYLLAREKGLCQICHKKFVAGSKARIHHCKQRNEQGSDRAENKAIIHEKCHINFHKKGLKMSAPKEYKADTFMSIVNKRFKQDIADINITFGYITFVNRNKLNIPKTHYNDAFVIAGGCTQERYNAFIIKQKHRNNRSLGCQRKGYAPASRKQRYDIQPKDLIWIDGKKFIVGGIQNKGVQVKIANSKKVYPTKNIEKTYHFGSFTY